tara:strand:- start:16 stop:135 length:120 start_codon:yes stop_codon:yes gene_type:complete
MNEIVSKIKESMSDLKVLSTVLIVVGIFVLVAATKFLVL